MAAARDWPPARQRAPGSWRRARAAGRVVGLSNLTGWLSIVASLAVDVIT
jgi:hypothetical protein